MGLEVTRHLDRVVADAVHAQRQRLDALQYLKGRHRAQRRAHVAQRHHARPADVGSRAQRLGVDHAVVADIGLVEPLETRLVLCPGELARIDDHPADGGAVAAQVFGERVNDDVRAVLDRAAQVGAGHGVVHHQGHAVRMGHGGQGTQVGDVA